MKKIIVRIELFIILILAIAVLVFGLSKGVWDGSKFYGVTSGDNKRVYADQDKTSVEIVSEGDKNNINISSSDGKTASLAFEITENGSYKNIKILSEENSEVLSASYNAKADELVGKVNGESKVSNFIRETNNFNPGISDKTISKMLLGSDKVRIAGKSKELLLGVFFIALGFAFNFLTKFIIKLDKFFIGIFYENSEKLKASELAQNCLIVSGIVFFVIGLLFFKSILLA